VIAGFAASGLLGQWFGMCVIWNSGDAQLYSCSCGVRKQSYAVFKLNAKLSGSMSPDLLNNPTAQDLGRQLSFFFE
jgi:hypothetical protein